jgi:hypothetical protein
MNQEGLLLFLPILLPSALGLDVRFDLPGNADVVLAWENFFRRTSVTSVCLRLVKDDYKVYLQRHLLTLPDLRTLFLDYSKIRSTFLPPAEMTYSYLELDIPMGEFRDIYYSNNDDDGSTSRTPDICPVSKMALVNYPRSNVSASHVEETLLRYAKTLVVNRGFIPDEDHEQWDELVREHNM